MKKQYSSKLYSFFIQDLTIPPNFDPLASIIVDIRATLKFIPLKLKIMTRARPASNPNLSRTLTYLIWWSHAYVSHQLQLTMLIRLCSTKKFSFQGKNMQHLK
ncbi:hypothetical protein CDAR_251151 [Caerostris darwini]|uniref:Uncharacterized protein n=1 Tax=Caerostris darwini TaxID=1538125 RepID=A0AAV4RX37_9ARAC|nr:hypothetical protein CDAR_251151 [Caerostris darwini]